MSLQQELQNFTGTTQYHKSTFDKLLLTDGIQYLREKGKCYWLIDIVESYQRKLKNIPFQLWTLEVNEDQTAVVICKEDTNTPVLVRQKIGYTDFPLDKIEFYCIDGVVLLKSEY
jgi:hypothetical protein